MSVKVNHDEQYSRNFCVLAIGLKTENRKLLRFLSDEIYLVPTVGDAINQVVAGCCSVQLSDRRRRKAITRPMTAAITIAPSHR
jgi:hypothetical protein